MFYFDTINNKKILKSTLLSTVEHFFTTRESVITPKDSPELSAKAIKNIDDIANYLKIEKSNIISPIQTHSDNIAIAKLGETHPNTDALIVAEPNIAIALNFADCTPVIIYDKENNIGAISHAGWRGASKRIVPKTINYMIKKFQTTPQNIVAVIGPSIGINNYEVDQNVYEQLKLTLKYDYSDWYQFNKDTNKYKVDLKTINYHQLKELDVKMIDKCDYCTYDSVDIFFSYRKENGKTARHSAILKLLAK